MKSLKFFKPTLATTLAIVLAWLLSVRAAEAAAADFNGDGHPDFLLFNFNTQQTAVLFMNNNVAIGSAFGPTLPFPWLLRPGADFNGDGHTDCVLLNDHTGQTVIVYLSGTAVVGFAFGPSLPSSDGSWDLVAAADFNGDGHPDYLFLNFNTGETMINYLNNNVVVDAAHGPTLPAGLGLIGVADFNGDGHPDCVVLIPTNPEFTGGGQTAIAYMSGSTVIGVAPGPTIPPSWVVVGTADFNGDGHPDFLLYNFNTRETAIDYLSNNVLVNAAMGPTLATLPLGWIFPF